MRAFLLMAGLMACFLELHPVGWEPPDDFFFVNVDRVTRIRPKWLEAQGQWGSRVVYAQQDGTVKYQTVKDRWDTLINACP